MPPPCFYLLGAHDNEWTFAPQMLEGAHQFRMVVKLRASDAGIPLGLSVNRRQDEGHSLTVYLGPSGCQNPIGIRQAHQMVDQEFWSEHGRVWVSRTYLSNGSIGYCVVVVRPLTTLAVMVLPEGNASCDEALATLRSYISESTTLTTDPGDKKILVDGLGISKGTLMGHPLAIVKGDLSLAATPLITILGTRQQFMLPAMGEDPKPEPSKPPQMDVEALIKRLTPMKEPYKDPYRPIPMDSWGQSGQSGGWNNRQEREPTWDALGKFHKYYGK